MYTIFFVFGYITWWLLWPTLVYMSMEFRCSSVGGCKNFSSFLVFYHFSACERACLPACVFFKWKPLLTSSIRWTKFSSSSIESVFSLVFNHLFVVSKHSMSLLLMFLSFVAAVVLVVAVVVVLVGLLLFANIELDRCFFSHIKQHKRKIHADCFII